MMILLLASHVSIEFRQDLGRTETVALPAVGTAEPVY